MKCPKCDAEMRDCPRMKGPVRDWVCPMCGHIEYSNLDRKVVCHFKECTHNQDPTCEFEVVVLSPHFNGCVNFAEAVKHEEAIKNDPEDSDI